MRRTWDWPLDRRRHRLAQRCRGEPMKAYLATQTPRADAFVKETEFIVLDLETTGLEPANDEIVSMGWVMVARNRVLLASASHVVVRCTRPMNQSAVIHGVMDSDIEAGAPLEQAMDELLSVLAGRVMVVHHAPLDLGFLNKACNDLYGVPLLVRCVDTLGLEKRRRARRDQSHKSGELRLGALRDHYGLPRARAHDALLDAIATAELFLAMVRQGEGNGQSRIGQLFT